MQRNQIILRLGAVIRECRVALDLTQEELAEKADLSTNYIGNLERGEQEPSVTALVKVAAGLGITASSLIAQAGY
ncbi:helix-turn-helix domain-containing protein [Geminisphaera colitermitum]|uniref:helix-turn-helix domain-containing protein n=1 Tax=Geminisphaera colitermitum TaxID=1148786 RepID=UPI000196518E|nr:helix-turn-helix transcriptional regulator [Geminisphaera colitermitum]